MPVYKFRCSCGEVFEQLEPMDTVQSPCKCGKMAQYEFTCDVAIHIPLHMTAEADRFQRVADKTLQSRSHYKTRAAQELYEDKQRGLKESFNKFNSESADLVIEHQERKANKTGPQDYETFLKDQRELPEWAKTDTSKESTMVIGNTENHIVTPAQ